MSSQHELVFTADLAPAVSGEVYRLDFDGRRVDLSRSPFADTAPTVSPDGRWVAFLSDRDGSERVYAVPTAGGVAQPISGQLFRDTGEAELAWSPDSRRLAVAVALATASPMGSLLVVGPGLPQRTLASSSGYSDPGWSPDGSLVTADEALGGVEAFALDGRQVWSRPSDGGGAGWSSDGLYAPGPLDGVVHVVDTEGRTVFAHRATEAVWSPGGSRLALLDGRKLVVWDAATRRVTTRPAARGGFVRWVSRRRVVVDCCVLPLFTLSADGRVRVDPVRSGRSFLLRVERAGRAPRVVGRVPGCGDDGNFSPAVRSLQVSTDDRALIYQSDCEEPLAGLFSVRPDGSGLRRISGTTLDHSFPAIARDGRLAYTWARWVGLSCKGCAQNLALVPGSRMRVVTRDRWGVFDTDASWSPDGKSLLFVRGTATTSRLVVLDLATRRVRGLGIPAFAAAWGPRRIAWINGRVLRIAQPDGSGARRIAVGDLTSPTWSREGRLAWLRGTSLCVRGTTTRCVRLPFALVRQIAWSPDGNRIAVVARAADQPAADVYTMAPDGRDLRRITTDMSVTGVAWG